MLQFHPQVRRDATHAIRHYDSISDSLGDDSWAKFDDNPSGWRRANLKRFPYHLLFYEELDGAEIMALRHDRRDPHFGLRRK